MRALSKSEDDPEMQIPAPNPKQAEVQNGTSPRADLAAKHPRPEHRRPAGRSAARNRLGRLREASPWSRSWRKRLFDACAASAVLLLASPVLLLIALAVRLTSPGPAVFRQTRVGRYGHEFTIFKFRTMHCAAAREEKPGSARLRSAHKDHRLTPPGRWLRKYKLDELPQLINVVRGDMSLVGPRPKLHAHHTVDTPFRPGITGAATLAFAAEELLLRNVHHDDLEGTHARLISPRKIQLDRAYMARATFRSDLLLITRTLLRAGRYTDLAELTGEPHRNSPAPAQAEGRIYPELLQQSQPARTFESVSL